MGQQDVYKLSDIISACKNYINNPTDENQDIIIEIRKNLDITSYLSFSKKQEIIRAILELINKNDGDAASKENIFSISKILLVDLSYIKNLDMDLKIEEVDEEVIDFLVEFGILGQISLVSEKDIHVLGVMLDEALNFNHIYNLLAVMSCFDESKIDGLVNAVAQLQNSLTPEALADLKELAISGSPEYQALIEVLKEKIVHDTNEKLVKEQIIKESGQKGDA